MTLNETNRSREKSGILQYTQRAFFSQSSQRRAKAVLVPSPLNLSCTTNDILNQEEGETDEIEIDLEFKDAKEYPEDDPNFKLKPTLQPLASDLVLVQPSSAFSSTFSQGSQYNLPKSQSPICTICNFFIDEDLLELSCFHLCHRDCFINNILTCKKCSEGSTESLTVNEKPILQKDFETPKMGPIDVPMTPSDQMIPDPLRSSPKLNKPLPQLLQHPTFASTQNYEHAPISRLQQTMKQDEPQQLLSPRSSFNKNLNRDLFDSLMKPKINFIPEYEDSNISINNNCEDYKLNYLLNVKPPIFYETLSEAKNLPLKNQILEEIKFSLLQNNIRSNDEVFDFSSLGKLIIFELVDISTSGSNWDLVRLLLFEQALIFTDLKGEVLISKMLFGQDILGMTRFVSGLRLSLNNETVPELQICSELPLVISRLEYYFNKLFNRQFIAETSLFQVTTTGWGLIKENYSNLPVEIIRFQNCIENNLEIPEHLLIKSMPAPEIIPLNLIVSITLLNSSGLSNVEYKSKIIQFLENVRSNLRPFDRMSLIFVGIDGVGFPSKKGSFIGSVEPNWSGWDSIYNEVKVQSNLNHQEKPILTSHWDELQLSLDKCKDLFPFLASGSKNINKFIILSSNNYEPKLVNHEGLSLLENRVKTLLNNNEKNLSIDFFRIGETHTPELEFGQKICSQPCLLSNDVLKIPYGSRLVRFDNFEEFSDEFLNILKNTYHQICLPEISLDLLKIIGTRDIVNLYKIEVNGKMLEVESFSNLKLVMNNITVHSEKSIMLSLRLNLSKFRYDNLMFDKTIEIPLLSYMSSWLNQSDDYKVLNAKASQDQPTNTFSSFVDGSLTPPTNEEPFMFPKTKRNPEFTKKELAIEVIRGLRTMNSNVKHNEATISHLKTEVIDAKRALGETQHYDWEHNKKVAASKYFFSGDLDIPIEKYYDIIFENLLAIDTNDRQNLSTVCKDFINWLI